MTSSSIVNSAGLVFDIVGAILLIKFGIPNKIDPKGRMVIEWDAVDQDEIKKANAYKRWSNISILLIIFGFLLQLISIFSKPLL